MEIVEILFSLLRLELFDTPIDKKLTEGLGEESVKTLYSLSRAHDISHIVGAALDKLSVKSEEYTALFKKEQMTAVFRYHKIKHELGRICSLFEESGIAFIPLKGSVIREYYKTPWMRTSCDIDILVHEEDLQRAIKLLGEKLSYTTDGKINYHDVSLFSKSGVHLELHYNIRESVESLDRVLDTVWENAALTDNSKYKYMTSNEFVYFHAIAHLSYHFKKGGCGIRGLIDIYILNNCLDFDGDLKKKLLADASLLKFEAAVKELSLVWLEGKPHTEITRAMEDYIISGGVYGTNANRVAMTRVESKSTAAYLMRRIWIPYDSLKYTYPVLFKHKWLLPFCEVRRWFRFLFSKKARRVVNELRGASLAEEEKKKIEYLIEELEI